MGGGGGEGKNKFMQGTVQGEEKKWFKESKEKKTRPPAKKSCTSNWLKNETMQTENPSPPIICLMARPYGYVYVE